MYILEIIFFFIITVLLVIKLFSVLGRKDETSFSTSINSFKDLKNLSLKDVEILDRKNLSPEAQLKISDPKFSLNDFTKKSKMAYEMTLRAYADGDTQILMELVTIEMMRKLAYNIAQREEKHHTAQIVSFNEISESISSIEIKDNTAKIYIKLTSEIAFHIEDNSQKTIKDSNIKPQKIDQELCFTKRLNNTDPTWKIESILNLPF